MYKNEPLIRFKSDKTKAYYSLYWSALEKADKYKVTSSVPSVSGLYELYYEDDGKRLNLLTIAVAWLGGLRSEIRTSIDPDGKSEEIKDILENRKLYYRYTISPSIDAIKDVAWFLNQVYFKDASNVQDSGKFETIFVEEFAPDKIHWV